MVVGQPKTVKAMAVQLLFTSESDEERKLTCYVNRENLLYIAAGELDNIEYSGHVVLDKITAIRLSKHLNKCISEMMDNE